MFKKYQHIERYGTDEVEGIECGTCYVFPKIDGTNGSIWYSDGVSAGSRNRELTLDEDNQGFYKWVLDQDNFCSFFKKNKNVILYGEWLVPHSLKTYRDSAWRKFYVFDVCTLSEDKLHYLPYEEYKPILEKYDIEYIPAIKIIENGAEEKFRECLDNNTYLIEEGKGFGEGIVIKNYDFVNKYGRTTWAKIVRNEFKDKHRRKMGTPKVDYKIVEKEIVDKYCSEQFIKKTYRKILTRRKTGWRSEYIPELLSRVFHDFIVEESWNFIKEFKNPTINYKRLKGEVVKKIKEVMAELF